LPSLINSLSVLNISPECVLAGAVAPRTGKIIKIRLNVFEKGENLIQNGILNFAKSIVVTLESLRR